MDEKSHNQDVLLAKEKENDEIKVVSGIDKNGRPKVVDHGQENESQFLKIDKYGNALENFMSNFLRQYNDPTHFQFFKVPMDQVNEVVKNLQEAMKKPDEPASKEVIDRYKVNTQDEGQKQPSYAIEESRVDWSQLERFGVTRETLERTKSLEAMLNWQKSPTLIPITTRFDDVTLRTDARLSFREMPDGRLVLSIHAIRKEPELNRPYYGIKFTDEDKHNLLTTGNLGRVVDADFKQGEKTPVFISLDKLTNELIALRTDKIQIPENIKGVTLNDTQKKELSEGKAILIENMTSKKGSEFSAHVQINADKKSIEFHFDQNEKQNEHKQDNVQNREVHIPKTLLGVELSEKQQGKLLEGQTVYISGMKDEKGQEFNAYVKVNNEKTKLDFFKWNPDKSKEISPDNASKTQVAVNSEGKTNEATKSVNEPLKKEQTQPTDNQAEKHEKKEVKKNKQESDKPRKLKGIKI